MPTRFNLTRAGALALALSMLVACGTIAASFQGFNARLAGGYSTVTYARDSAGVLLDAGAIEPEEAANVQGQADHLRAALDLTRELHTRDPDMANGKLAATLAALNGLRDYLVALEAKEAGDGN